MNITSILSNKHTSASAAAFFALKGGSHVLTMWFPAHEAQIKSTIDWLEGAAIAYMGFAAGDAAKSVMKPDAEPPPNNQPPTK